MPVRTLTLLILCAAFGPPAAAQSSHPRRQLLSVELKSDQIDITTDGPANFNSFKLRHPTRVVIDFPETDAAASERTLSDGGLITGWKIENLGEANERVARLTIQLRTDSDYTLSSRTNDVELHLIPATARPLVALEDERTVSLDPVPQPVATQSPPQTAVAIVAPRPVVHEVPRSAVIVAHDDPAPKPLPIAPAPKPVLVAVKAPVAPPQPAPVVPVKIAVKETPKPLPAPVVHHEPALVKVAMRETPRPQPVVRLTPPAAAPVVHHEPVMVAVKETPRPLPVVHVAPPPAVHREPVKIAVKEAPKPLPVVHHEPEKIAVKETPKPLPVVHQEPVKIAVKETPKPLPAVHVAPPEPVKIAVRDVPPPLPVVHVVPPVPVVHLEPVKVAVKDVPPPLPVIHVVPPPEPIAPAPKVAAADEPPLLPEVVVTPMAPAPVSAEPPPTERKPRSMKPVRLGAIGFHVQQEGPEIILHTSGPVAYAMREGADNRLYLDIDRAEITVATDRLPLDTSYFDTPVVRIAPREDRARHRVSIEIDLRAPAPYELASDGSTLRVRFPALPSVAVQGQPALSLVAAP